MICPACNIDLGPATQKLGIDIIEKHIQSHRTRLVFKLLKASTKVAKSDGKEGIDDLKQVLGACEEFEIRLSEVIDI